MRRQTIASLPELTVALGAVSRRTVFRMLKQLAYRASYSHRGRYYVLDECARFDPRGLWDFHGVRFSRHGTLLATAEALARSAEAGCFVEELDELLGVGTGDALRKLVRDGRLARSQVGGRFLHCGPEPGRKSEQLTARKMRLAAVREAFPAPALAEAPDRLRSCVALFLSLLDEQQRRLFAGLESLRCGYGGDSEAGAALGLDRSTVARGRQELLARDVLRDRARRPGGGRKSLGEKPLR